MTVADSRIDELRRRLERDPGSRLFAQLAEEHRKGGEHAEAIRVARAGLALHPAYPSARLTLGRALLDSGDAGGARAELEAALRDAPDNILASRFLGQALEALGELGPALRQLEKTLKMAPGDRQLEGQIVALRTRLGSPVARPGVAPPPLDEGQGDPATLRILRAGDRGGAPVPPPLPPSAPATPGGALASTTPVAAPRPPSPAARAEGAPPAPPPATDAPALITSSPDERPSLPPEGAREVTAPATPGGALTVEEMLFEAEGGLEGGAGDLPSGAAGKAWVEDAAAADATPFSSSTLAELYFRQGLVGRAVEVYRQVLAEEPGNARARLRLQEITSALPADGRTARRRELERTIARLEALLAAVRRRA